MKLNLDYYSDEYEKNIDNIKLNKISEYIEKYKEEDYEKIFDFDMDDFTIYNMSNIRKNVVAWYPFNYQSNLLEIGSDLGALTHFLCSKVANVTSIESSKLKSEIITKRCSSNDNLNLIVGSIEKIKFDIKYDYIVLIDVDKYIYENNIKDLEILLKILKNLLNQNGKLIFAINNKFGLKYWAGKKEIYFKDEFLTLSEGNTENIYRGYSKNKIEDTLKLKNLNYKVYYPLPDFNFTNVIFSDNYLPDDENILKYFPLYNQDSNIIFNEIEVYKQLMQDNIENFKFFANTFIYECSLQEFENDIRGVYYNNHRKSKYRLITKIKDNITEKENIDLLSKEHFDNMKENLKYFKQNGFNIIDSVVDGKIQSKFIKSYTTVDKDLRKHGYNEDIVVNTIQRLKDALMNVAKKYDPDENNIFKKYLYNTDENILKKFSYLKYGFWDAILQNCFNINNEWYFFDQEWIEENVPIEFIIYRTLYYNEYLKNSNIYDRLCKKFGIYEYVDLFRNLEIKLQENITDKNMWIYLTKRYNNPIVHNKNLIKANNEMSVTIENLNKMLNERNKDIDYLNNLIWDKEKDISQLKDKLKQVQGNKLWKVGNSINSLFKNDKEHKDVK